MVGLSGGPSPDGDSPPYVELAARSAFTLLEGASTPEALAERAGEIGAPALALTDRFDLGGAVRFARACRAEGVEPLVGGEVRREGWPPVVLLCRNREGYANLSSLITRARRSNPRGEPSLPRGVLKGRTQGVVALARVVAGGGDVSAETPPVLEQLDRLFGDRLYLALEHHGLPEEARACAAWVERAEEAGIPWLPVNAPLYARPRDRIVQDVLTCLRHDVTLDGAGDRLRPNGEWYLKSARQMRVRWCERGDPGPRSRSGCRDRSGASSDASRPPGSPSLRQSRSSGAPDSPASPPGAPGTGRDDSTHRARGGARDGEGATPSERSSRPGASPCTCRGCRALRRTARVAESCSFRISDLEPRLPSFDVPGGRSSGEFLRALVGQGARERYGEDFGPEHREQIEHELDVVQRLELADYFLIVWDIVRFANRRGILVQGRGSAANSAVCYCLGITAVDPVGMDLLFERFLSEERGEAPDIDLDIAHDDREEVLQYVYRRYGRDHAAMVCESITYRGRMAVRDAARVLGFGQETADELAAEVDRGEAEDAAGRLEEGGAARAGLDPGAARTRALIHVVRGLDRLPRHRSIHVGGFVIGKRPVGETVPVEEASMEGRTIIQWDKDDLALVGMIKIDLLGLGMLTVLGETLAHLRRTRGVSLDLAEIPQGDGATYDMICEADTVGVFQIESRAQMNTLPRVEPRSFYDLAIEVALIRPGPIQGEMVHPYLRRRRGEEEVTYLDERLKPVLERTLGVPLFQEQGMRVAIELAGFTPAQADRLRRAMGFKRSEREMSRVGRELAEGLEENDVPPEAREKVFRQLTAFSNYGFPESHALSFALLVYASSYLKRHFAPEFFCATLNAQPMGFYAPSTLVEDAKRHGVEVRPVDLARSAWDCTLEPREGGDAPALRMGLRLVRGLGSRAEEELRRAREEGPFTSVEDVVERSGLGEPELRTLAEAGAFDSLWPGRREALWELLRELRGDAGPLAPRPRAGDGSGEGSGSSAGDVSAETGGGAAADDEPPRRAGLPPLSRAERVRADYRTVGLSTEGHPMEFLRERLRRKGVLSAEELARQPAGAEVAVAGIAIVRQRPKTARGVMFVTLEDETGFANFVVTPDLLEERRSVLVRSPVLRMEGIVEREGEVVNVQTERVFAVDPRAGAGEVTSRDFR